MHKIILATGNQGKLVEFVNLTNKQPWQVLSLKDFPQLVPVIETGTSFRENARLKALAAAKETGLVALADDSGLIVDFLGAEPGVHSARFAGEDSNDEKNNRKLLQMMHGVPISQRTARFVCSIAVVTPDEEVKYCDGVVEGLILTAGKGENGFGYDPLFYLPSYRKTMAQLTLTEKNQISHRAEAFRKTLPILMAIFAPGK